MTVQEFLNRLSKIHPDCEVWVNRSYKNGVQWPKIAEQVALYCWNSQIPESENTRLLRSFLTDQDYLVGDAKKALESL